MRTILTPSDLAERKIDPGWYPAEITKYEEAVTKGSDDKPSDGSMNAIFYFSVQNPKEPDMKPRELKRYFNEKALGMGKNLWVLLGFLKKGSDGKVIPGELTSEMFASSVGKKMLVYIKKNNAGFDNIEDYRPLPV